MMIKLIWTNWRVM